MDCRACLPGERLKNYFFPPPFISLMCRASTVRIYAALVLGSVLEVYSARIKVVIFQEHSCLLSFAVIHDYSPLFLPGLAPGHGVNG